MCLPFFLRRFVWTWVCLLLLCVFWPVGKASADAIDILEDDAVSVEEDVPSVVSSDSGFSDWRVDASAALISVGQSWDQTSVGDGLLVPHEASFEHHFPSSAWGLSSDVQLWWQNRWGADIRFQWAPYLIEIAEDSYSKSMFSAVVGARYRYDWLEWLEVEGGAGFRHADVTGIAYKPGRVGGEPVAYAIDGMYLSGAALLTFDNWQIRFEWMETFALAPVDSTMGLSVGWRMPELWSGAPPVTLLLDYRGDWRTVEEQHVGVPIAIEDERHLVGVGFQVSFDHFFSGRGTPYSDVLEEETEAFDL